MISKYDDAVEEIEEKIDYSEEWEIANQYNKSLLPSILPDSFAIAAAAGEPAEDYMAALNLLGDGIMGTVEIPKIDVKIPIYHTTSEDVLQLAAGHLEGSSLPVGGKDTHAVISAHRGLPSASLFTDLDLLEIGDHFAIHVLDETLYYEVEEILVVEPEETDTLSVEPGRDLVTLLTCTPYGVNSHRLLVTGYRVDYTPELLEVEVEQGIINPSIHTNYLLWVIVGLAVTFLVIIILTIREKHIRRKMIAAKNKE